MIWLTLGALGLFLALIFISNSKSKELGKAESEKENTDEVLSNVEKGKQAKERLTDPGYAQWLRDKYTRK